MNIQAKTSPRKLFSIVMSAWLVVLGLDFFLHAGLLAGLYEQRIPGLLSPQEAFGLIPFGYLSLLLEIVLIVWLSSKLGIRTGKRGIVFGASLGMLLGASSSLGMFSILAIPHHVILAWGAGQAVEITAAGLITGASMGAIRLWLVFYASIAVFVLLLLVTVIVQNLV